MAIHKAVITIVSDTDKDETDVKIEYDPSVSDVQPNYSANTANRMFQLYLADRQARGIGE